MDGRIPAREQGDIGERSALRWLIDQGTTVFLPFGHSPDVDLVADFGDRLVRVQVKTSTVLRADRSEVMLATPRREPELERHLQAVLRRTM